MKPGLALAERYGLSIYDSMIAASALEAGCDTLWSEDMQDGMVLDGQVRIVNPFAGRDPSAPSPTLGRSRAGPRS